VWEDRKRARSIALKFRPEVADIKVKSFRKPIVKVDSSTNPNLTPLNNGVQRSQQGDTAAPGANAARTPVSSGGGAAADVSLSALSGHLQSIATSGSADIDTAHVESIKQAISNGTLKIDASKIADGVLETARNLLQGSRPSGS
jgi:negative regulator of flagellin synthesis FlgM